MLPQGFVYLFVSVPQVRPWNVMKDLVQDFTINTKAKIRKWKRKTQNKMKVAKVERMKSTTPVSACHWQVCWPKQERLGKYQSTWLEKSLLGKCRHASAEDWITVSEVDWYHHWTIHWPRSRPFITYHTRLYALSTSRNRPRDEISKVTQVVKNFP